MRLGRWHRRLGGAPVRTAESGFTMVMLIVILAVMAIMMTVAVQTVTFQMRREKEAELIFRGNQYVEAIRLYKIKYGRLPNSLKEIWEAKPRVIRKKWEDPITGSTNWGLVFLGDTGPKVGPGGRPIGGGQGSLPTPTPTPEPTPGSGDEGGSLFGKPVGRTGPIVGVHSRSCEDSIKIVDGRTRYCDWKFVIPEAKPGGRPVQPGGSGSPFLPPGVSVTPRPTSSGGGNVEPPTRWTPQVRRTPRP